ncbi:uncharacterized protein CIMG_13729 [Coccidioides immitis RS]|uniref:Uncharacterized protein n=1 Tax=Coccidioides immitis (strain RS) TaxID=246410 RepID=A0A0D8JWM3_COCIM|nr:uncharacterized protein CIMG_13729 [Coccidioides immitis RS]KJF61539.1 hypothetical protein CIMG_13729 [Coccidioides immitis RS]
MALRPKFLWAISSGQVWAQVGRNSVYHICTPYSVRRKDLVKLKCALVHTYLEKRNPPRFGHWSCAMLLHYPLLYGIWNALAHQPYLQNKSREWWVVLMLEGHVTLRLATRRLARAPLHIPQEMRME